MGQASFAAAGQWTTNGFWRTCDGCCGVSPAKVEISTGLRLLRPARPILAVSSPRWAIVRFRRRVLRARSGVLTSGVHAENVGGELLQDEEAGTGATANLIRLMNSYERRSR